MRVISQDRVFLNGELFIKGRELDVDPKDPAVKDFLKSRMLIAKQQTEQPAAATAPAGNPPNVGRGYNRRDIKAVEIP